MSYATGHNSFTSQYLLNIYIYSTLQIMYNKCVKKMGTEIGNKGLHSYYMYVIILCTIHVNLQTIRMY